MDDNYIFKTGKKYFYGGDIDGIIGDLSITALDKILD